MIERTLAMIKPDGVARGLIGEVIRRIEVEHLKIIDIKMTQLTQEQAKEFYAVHKGSVHYEGLTNFTASGPVVVMVLEGLFAVSRWRDMVGATRWSEAVPGTIRRDFGHTNIVRQNVVHGSDSPETAEFEINYFFKESNYV